MVMALLLTPMPACGGADREAREERAVRAAKARAESTATRVAAIARTGEWTAELVLERLVRAGVAPRAADAAPRGPEWMHAKPSVFAAGGGLVYAWIYEDSTARRVVTDALDPLTAAPAGRSAPFEAPFVLVVQSNLAAVITGGSERNQERIALALQGGIAATASPP